MLMMFAVSMAFAWEADDLIHPYNELSKLLINDFRVEPVLQHLNETEAAFLWITYRSSFSWLEIREKGSNGEWEKVQREIVGLLDAGSTMHRILITDLTPNTSYEVRAQVKTITSFRHKPIYGKSFTSPLYTFTTAKPDQEGIKIAILGDIHYNKSAYQKHVAKVNKANNYDALYLNGDFIDCNTTNEIVDYVLEKTNGLSTRKIPVYNVRGNHETRGGAARNINDFFYTPNGQIYQLIVMGDTAILLTDTGEDKPDNHVEYAGAVNFDSYREKEVKWIEKALTSDAWKNAKYKIAIGHIPVWNIEHKVEYMNSRNWHREWMDLYNLHGVQLLLAAHTHHTEIVPPQTRGNHLYPIVIGAGPQHDKTLLMTCTTGNDKIVVERELLNGEKLESLVIDIK